MRPNYPWYVKLVVGVTLATGPILALYTNPYTIWTLKDEKSGLRLEAYRSDPSILESLSGTSRIFTDEEVQEGGLTIVGAKFVRRG